MTPDRFQQTAVMTHHVETRPTHRIPTAYSEMVTTPSLLFAVCGLAWAFVVQWIYPLVLLPCASSEVITTPLVGIIGIGIIGFGAHFYSASRYYTERYTEIATVTTETTYSPESFVSQDRAIDGNAGIIIRGDRELGSITIEGATIENMIAHLRDRYDTGQSELTRDGIGVSGDLFGKISREMARHGLIIEKGGKKMYTKKGVVWLFLGLPP